MRSQTPTPPQESGHHRSDGQWINTGRGDGRCGGRVCVWVMDDGEGEGEAATEGRRGGGEVAAAPHSHDNAAR